MKSEMNKRVFLDTSAFFKEYHDERGSDILHDIFNQAKDGRIVLCISVLTISEMLNDLDKTRKRHIISDSDCLIVADTILYDISELTKKEAMKIYEPTEHIIRSSWDLILTHHLSAIDSIQIITAIDCGADIFAAADTYLLSQAHEIGINTWNVEEGHEQ
jgi:predicted nucleic acid-binding protein